MSGPAVSTRPARSCKAAADILSGRDPVVRRLVAQAGPVRVNPPTETHFAALVRAILYQRLAGVAARAIDGRLIAALGGEVTPERFLSLSSQTVRAVGLAADKAASMRDLATKVLDGSVVLDPAGLHGQGDDEIVAMLAGVRDIGTWIAQMFLMFQLRRLDVSPAGDLGVRKGFGAGVGDADADSQATRGARRPVPALSFGRRVVLLARRRARGGAAGSALTS